jgi:hypothetical protein
MPARDLVGSETMEENTIRLTNVLLKTAVATTEGFTRPYSAFSVGSKHPATAATVDLCPTGLLSGLDSPVFHAYRLQQCIIGYCLSTLLKHLKGGYGLVKLLHQIPSIILLQQ